MYGAIVAAMLTTTAPAAPDWCWGFQGFGCSPYAWGYGGYYCGWGGWCYPWGYCGYYYPCYGWPVAYCYPVAAASGSSAREKALEAQIRELREEQRRLEGAAAPARVVVTLPTDARLFVDDDPCPLTGARRSFDTPDLKPGVTYHYTIRVELTRSGEPVKVSKRVTVEAGKATLVEFADAR